MPPNYQSIPLDAPRPQRGVSSKSFLRVAAISVIAVCALTCMTAVLIHPETPEPVMLAGRDSSARFGTLVGADLAKPGPGDMLTFQSEANTVFSYLGMDILNTEGKERLEKGCGNLTLPCMATVGKCLTSHISTNADSQRLEVAPETCECFTDGINHHIHLASGAEITCDFGCLDAMSQEFDNHLVSENGDSSSTVACPRAFTNMARQIYGTSDDSFPSMDDFDAGGTEPTADEHVMRAAQALADHIKLVRKLECPAIGQLGGTPEVKYDNKGYASGGLGQYLLEIELGHADLLFTGRVVHLPKDDQVTDTDDVALGDDRNLLGRFRVMRVSPDPCATGATAQLAMTYTGVKKINSQKLSWRATMRPEMEGKTHAEYALGYIPPSAEERKKHQKPVESLADLSIVDMPESYDARDRRSFETACRAFDVLDQGSCGSCYAFGAATALSARMCLKSNRKWNVVLSPQEMMDCQNGCNGGSAINIYRPMTQDGVHAVENFCDPYNEKKSECGGTCSEGNKYYGEEKSAYMIGGPTPEGVREMQKELLLHGPGAVSFDVYSDFHSYSGEGVYARSAGATKRGAHQVTLIGWGTEGGVDYWLIQNSWGAQSGDKGFYKIRRGTDECGFESYQMEVMMPETPTFCTHTECWNGGVPQKDCTCRCPDTFSGDKCQTCALNCVNGGIRADDCSRCYCPPGTTGKNCEGIVTLSTMADCQPETIPTPKMRKKIFIKGTNVKVTQKSFVGFFEKDATKWDDHETYKIGMICGRKYDKSVNGGFCPEEWTHAVEIPNEPGTYKVGLAPWRPMNEFGTEGYQTKLNPSDFFAVFTVTESCDADVVAAAAAANDLSDKFADQVKEIQKAEQLKQTHAEQRLTIAEKARADIIAYDEAQPDPAVNIPALDPEDPAIWEGQQFEVCWVLPAKKNVNPKTLRLNKLPDMYWSSGLRGQGNTHTVDAAAEGCVTTRISSSVPNNVWADIEIRGAGKTLAKSNKFKFQSAWADIWSIRAEDNDAIWIRVMWGTTGPHVKDTIVLKDTAGKVVVFFYTSCGCDDAPGDTPVGRSEHEMTLQLPKGHAPGGLLVSFHPKGGDLVAAVGDDWINWGNYDHW